MAKRPAAHSIADIHYEPGNGPCWSVCLCGDRMEAGNPDALVARWLRHRAENAPPCIRAGCKEPRLIVIITGGGYAKTCAEHTGQHRAA